MRQFTLLILTCMGCMGSLLAQPDRWQQRVKYKMDITMDVTTNRFTGKQQLEYTNNSPDTLKRVYYHLYWNAFQPNSMMDVRSRELGKNSISGRPDWDGRVRDRILNLKEDEIGYQDVKAVTMNGVAQKTILHETILEVVLSKPILPRSKVVFDMDFTAQVPLQVRRSGRDNPSTGVRYSMSQWYPKLCEYDYEGWHTDPYVAREFYGVWGDFDVKITIDKNYVLGGTGYLQNANAIGYGYEAKGAKVAKPAGNTLTWQFLAPNVHDFVWAADPEYAHITRQVPNGPLIHVLYNRDEAKLKEAYNNLKDGEKARLKNDVQQYMKEYDAQWERVAEAAVTVLPFIEKKFGAYPYKQYSFIHGGDGGMEYPMATLIVSSSLGTAFHEWMHSWYQMMLGTNESEYGWMDEGFTSFAETLVSDYYQAVNVVKETRKLSVLPQTVLDSLAASVSGSVKNPHKGAYDNYLSLAKSSLEEPLTTHADHFETNVAYSIASYSKGEVFMEQLGYIVGADTRDQILLEYYRQWRFKHPNVNDFIRVAENVSGIKLDWYKEYFVQTTKTINYGIDSMWQDGAKTKIRLKRIGHMPMPIDLQLELKDGSKRMEYIPMYLMFGAKADEYEGLKTTTHPSWKWTHPTYVVEVDCKMMDIRSIEIDPSQRMADTDRANNKLVISW
ncbi:MAG: M1 family metallopeptidase [Candidatus Pseudobacter hemicellulosilyticus]|uniref:M1 family metallopeptidase n=1 Tax=Candidatus Pseudobacter hemicellulosilyticus TaxID=3121375 RepID=A0AAJ5WW38_9BACT|nr:MAG: M1 family metallopeptidase [Pseudobacter sp.]